MTLTPTQIKLGYYGAIALLLWWFSRGTGAAPPPGRVTKTLEIEANVYNENFGLTDAEIAAKTGAAPAAVNPAVDPKMHELIDRSNLLILED